LKEASYTKVDPGQVPGIEKERHMPKMLLKKLLQGIVTLMATRPEFMETLFTSVINAILNRGAAPVPTEEGNDHFLPSDDPVELPPRDEEKKPSLTAPVHKVELRILRAQYNGKLFPKMYTKDNPFGLYSQSELKKCASGEQAFNRESKLWLDLSPFVKVNKKDYKLTRDEVLKRGMAYLTQHTCITAGEGETFIHGTGVDVEGQPKYTAEAKGAVGNGISAWVASLGYVHQVKVDEADKITIQGMVWDTQVGENESSLVVSNILKIRVS